MGTVNKEIADQIVASQYPEDRARRIVEYTNAWGDLAYGVTFEDEDPAKYLRPSQYIQNPKIYWDAP